MTGYLQRTYHRRLDDEYIYQIATQPGGLERPVLRTLLDELVASVRGIEGPSGGPGSAGVDAAGLFGRIFERIRSSSPTLVGRGSSARPSRCSSVAARVRGPGVDGPAGHA